MTHVVDEVSLIDVVTQRTRSLNLHSCAGGSPLAPDRLGAGCVDCHYGNGGVRGDEGDGSDGLGVLGWWSRESETPGEKLRKKADEALNYSNAVKLNQELLSYLFQGQMVGGSALNCTPPLWPLPCAPSMLRGGR